MISGCVFYHSVLINALFDDADEQPTLLYRALSALMDLLDEQFNHHDETPLIEQVHHLKEHSDEPIHYLSVINVGAEVKCEAAN